jgi:hypothetical protein
MEIDMDVFCTVKNSVLLLVSRKVALLKSRQATQSRSKKGTYFGNSALSNGPIDYVFPFYLVT